MGAKELYLSCPAVSLNFYQFENKNKKETQISNLTMQSSNSML
jgi:hypothetical protein